jgi:hypothetical protein
MRRALLLLSLLAVGCGQVGSPNPDPIEISGKVSMGGQPVDNVRIVFHVTGDGMPGGEKVVNGEFKTKVVPGKYAWYFVEEDSPADLEKIPEKFREATLERQITINSAGEYDFRIE